MCCVVELIQTAHIFICNSKDMPLVTKELISYILWHKIIRQSAKRRVVTKKEN
jgi:hypothetical protein